MSGSMPIGTGHGGGSMASGGKQIMSTISSSTISVAPELAMPVSISASQSRTSLDGVFGCWSRLDGLWLLVRCYFSM